MLAIIYRGLLSSDNINVCSWIGAVEKDQAVGPYRSRVPNSMYSPWQFRHREFHFLFLSGSQMLYSMSIQSTRLRSIVCALH
jgi:hypothetical protein